MSTHDENERLLWRIKELEDDLVGYHAVAERSMMVLDLLEAKLNRELEKNRNLSDMLLFVKTKLDQNPDIVGSEIPPNFIVN